MSPDVNNILEVDFGNPPGDCRGRAGAEMVPLEICDESLSVEREACGYDPISISKNSPLFKTL